MESQGYYITSPQFMTNVTVFIWTGELVICICPDVAAFLLFLFIRRHRFMQVIR